MEKRKNKKSDRYANKGLGVLILFLLLVVIFILVVTLLVVDNEKRSSMRYGGSVEMIEPSALFPKRDLKEENKDNLRVNGMAEMTGEENSLDDVLEGDAPVYDERQGADKVGEDEILFLFPASTESIRASIVALTEEYNEKIPYGYQGRCYGYGYLKYEDGYTNQLFQNCAGGIGLDGLGYVIWLYRNALGCTPEELKGDFSADKLYYEVSLEELEIGDFCMSYNGNEDVDYGVVCGFVDGHPVISMCDNHATGKFAFGCNHLSFVKQDYDERIGIYDAVDFKNFFRLEEFW